MRCPECRFENREGAKFCKKYGANLELACPICNSILTEGSIFCDECGLLADQDTGGFGKGVKQAVFLDILIQFWEINPERPWRYKIQSKGETYELIKDPVSGIGGGVLYFDIMLKHATCLDCVS